MPIRAEHNCSTDTSTASALRGKVVVKISLASGHARLGFRPNEDLDALVSVGVDVVARKISVRFAV
jgi:hypothetical protein